MTAEARMVNIKAHGFIAVWPSRVHHRPDLILLLVYNPLHSG